MGSMQPPQVTEYCPPWPMASGHCQWPFPFYFSQQHSSGLPDKLHTFVCRAELEELGAGKVKNIAVAIIPWSTQLMEISGRKESKTTLVISRRHSLILIGIRLNP